MTPEETEMARRIFPGKSLLWLEAAVAETHGTHQVVDVLHQVLAGKLIVFRGKRSIGVGEWIQFPRKRVFNMFLAGGDAREFRAVRAGVEAFARGGGADAVQFCGRLTDASKARLSGWLRLIPGYVAHWVCFMKELN